MARGELGVTGGAGLTILKSVMHRGGMGMAIGGVEIEILQARVSGKGIGHAVSHDSGQLCVGFSAECQAAFTFQRVEKMINRGKLQLALHGLEEITTAFDALDHTADSNLEPVLIAELGTGASVVEFRQEVRNRAEEMLVKRGCRRTKNGHKKIIFSIPVSQTKRWEIFGAESMDRRLVKDLSELGCAEATQSDQ